jgi:hypothetical protein
MFPLPPEIIALLANFAPVFDKRVWEHAMILLVGAILALGKRTVTAALRIMGLSDEKHFINYHRVLSRATWSSLALSRILLGLLILLLLSANAPLLLVVDDTLERRRGAQIKAKGVFRDAVRSSEKHVVTCFGLRWVCLMLLVPLPWATRPWALPFLTVLAPSARTQKKYGRHNELCGLGPPDAQASASLVRYAPLDFAGGRGLCGGHFGFGVRRTALGGVGEPFTLECRTL